MLAVSLSAQTESTRIGELVYQSLASSAYRDGARRLSTLKPSCEGVTTIPHGWIKRLIFDLRFSLARCVDVRPNLVQKQTFGTRSRTDEFVLPCGQVGGNLGREGKQEATWGAWGEGESLRGSWTLGLTDRLARTRACHQGDATGET